MIKMEKWLMLLVLGFLNNVCPSCPYPTPYGSEDFEEIFENDEHIKEDCKRWSFPSTNWPYICPQYCAGLSQSPIDLVNTTQAIHDNEPLVIQYMDVTPHVNIINNGRIPMLTLDGGVYFVSGSGLDGDYTLAQFHFHWGCENSRGSEHTVDGQSYPMELMFVHYKASYGSISEARKYSDGFFVLSIFFIIGTENAAIKPITDNLSQITAAGTDADIPYNLDLKLLLPMGEKPEYYRYNGSSTIPSCKESVIYNIFKSPKELSQAQMDALRSLQDHDGNPICDNNRGTQPLNGRTVHFGTTNL